MLYKLFEQHSGFIEDCLSYLYGLLHQRFLVCFRLPFLTFESLPTVLILFGFPLIPFPLPLTPFLVCARLRPVQIPLIALTV